MEAWRSLRDNEKPVFSEDYETQLKELAECQQLKDFKAQREELSADPYRPLFHICRPDGNINDPNGFCYWEGRYHLFYQAGSNNAVHWGHVVSEDLVTWKDLPYAIYPNVEKCSFSGGTCVDEENHRVIAAYYGYTGYDENGWKCGIVVATSHDPLLLNWTKVNGGKPVIPDADAPGWKPQDAEPVPNQKPYKVFDANIWKENGVYYIITGVYDLHPETRRRHRQLYLFRCTDDNLENWEYVHTLLDHDIYKEVGDDCACPYFLDISGKRVLMHFSHRCAAKYLIGNWDPEKLDFYPYSCARFTSGYGIMVAPSAFVLPDGSGDAALIFNMSELHKTNRWSCMLTLPRRISVGGCWNDELLMKPLVDFSPIHLDHTELKDIALNEGEVKVLEGVAGNAFEMKLDVKSDNIPKTLEIEVLRSENAEEVTRVTFVRGGGGMYCILPNPPDNMIMVDTTHSSLAPDAEVRPPEHFIVPTENGEDLHMDIYVDRSVIDVFVNNKQCISMRVYPTRADSIGVALRARGTSGSIDHLDFHHMGSIFSDK